MKALPAVQTPARTTPVSPWLANPTGQLWHTLTSVRLALILILLIAVATLTGTLLDQVPASVANDPVAYNRWLEGARGRYGIFTDVMARLELLNVFSSIWFRGLIALLVANIVVCTINRWSSIRAQVFRPRVRMNPAYFDRARIGATFSVNLATATAAATVRQGLRSAGYRSLTEDGESVAMYADRFRFSRLGTFLTHLSLVLLLVGAIMGRAWGWSDNQFIVAQGATREVPLAKDISVKLEQFQEEWYVEGPPKDFSRRTRDLRQGPGSEARHDARQLADVVQGHRVQPGLLRTGCRGRGEGRRRQRHLQRRAAGVDVEPGQRPVGLMELPGQQVTGYIVGPEPGSYDSAVPLGTVRLEL